MWIDLHADPNFALSSRIKLALHRISNTAFLIQVGRKSQIVLLICVGIFTFDDAPIQLRKCCKSFSMELEITLSPVEA